MTWAAWLVALAGPLLRRALIYMGFVSLSVLGVSAGFQAAITYAQANWSALPASLLGVASLAGVHKAIGIVIGAQVARIALWAKSNSARIVLKAPTI